MLTFLRTASADRLFKEHNSRKTTLLAGIWKFKTADNNEILTEIPSDAFDVHIPSCRNFELRLLEYQGLAWYFKEFDTDCKRLILPFGAVSGEGNDRARGFNNKGILNEYRKPKAAYFAVKKCLKTNKSQRRCFFEYH